MALPAFTPTGQVNLTAVGTTSTRATIPVTGTPTQVMVTHFGGPVAFLLLGDGTVVATQATGVPLLAENTLVLTLGANVAIAAVTAGGTARLRISAGS